MATPVKLIDRLRQTFLQIASDIKSLLSRVETLENNPGGSSSTTSLDRRVYTNVANETNFECDYTPPYVRVYLDGQKLPGGYTATTGTNIVLDEPIQSNDQVLEIEAISVTMESNGGVNFSIDRRFFKEFDVDGKNTFPLTYRAPFVKVWVNGLLIPKEEYTATNGTSITLSSNLSKNDILDIEGMHPFEVANTYTAEQIDNIVASYNETFVDKLNAKVNSDLELLGNGRRIRADFSNALLINRTMFQTSVANDNTAIGIIPSGVGKASQINLFAVPDVTNTPYLQLSCDETEAKITSYATGAASSLSMGFYVNNVQRIYVNAAGNITIRSSSDVPVLNISSTGVLSAEPVIGYGAGAGGTVTQGTSKSTAVTLNKASGQITMHNEALAASAAVIFVVNNTFMSATDTVTVTCPYLSVDPSKYRVEPAYCNNGLFAIRVTNITTGSLSEALVIQYNIHKGSAL